MTDPQPLPEQPAAPAATASPSDATSMPTEADLSASAAMGHTLASNGEVALPAENETAAAVPVDGSAEAAPAGPTAPAIPDMPPAQTAARLAELFPALFTPGQAKPLKLRIQADIQQRAPGLFNRKVAVGVPAPPHHQQRLPQGAGQRTGACRPRRPARG